ncbi:MAG: metallophosphoesterase [Gordonia sp. (in: high G+C Gram-positive bacteria)]
MVSILAVADEVVESLTFGVGIANKPDLILGAGDLPFSYLEILSSLCDAPCVFVPGNHDRDLRGYRRAAAGWTRAGLPAENPGPQGAINADGRIVSVGGVTIGGLGGCLRYNDGPNQYTEFQQCLRSRRLTARRRPGRRRPDILLTHAPARGVGDGDDRPHRGFACYHRLVERLRPRLLIHGHIHPYGAHPPDVRVGAGTVSMNVVGYCQFDYDPAGGAVTVVRRRHGA